MSYKLDFTLEPDYLYAKATGNRSADAIFGIAEDSLKACLEHGYNKLLIDVRSMTGRAVATADVYDVGQKFLEKFIQYPIKKAAIIDLEEHRERLRFLENVLVNRGFDIRVFFKVADAERWLRESKDISSKSGGE